MSNNMALFLAIVVFAFFAYIAIDFFRLGINGFMNKWALKILWIWLPFYAFYFLTKKIFEKINK